MFSSKLSHNLALRRRTIDQTPDGRKQILSD